MPRSVRFSITFVTLVTMLAILAPLYAACGGNQRQKTLHTSFVAVTAACDGLEAWDTTRQEQIIALAGPAPGQLTKEEARKQLDAHRAGVDKVYAACVVTYRAIAAASIEKDDATLKLAGEEATKLFAAVKDLKGAL